MLVHEKVIEEVLPVRFGTIASGADEIRNLLDRRYREFKTALRDVEHKIELGVKGIWKNMDVIFGEIVEEKETINLRLFFFGDKVPILKIKAEFSSRQLDLLCVNIR